MKELTAAQKVVIDSLAAIVAQKRQLVDGMGMMNAAADEATRMRQSMQFAQVRADLYNAEDALRDALTKYQ